MKSTVCLSALMLCCIALIGQTPVPAGDIFGIWSIDGSPYLIEGNTTVPDGSSLVIEPGVRVEFQGSYTMFVQGRILAQGTVTDSIVFTAADTAEGFNSIRFLQTPVQNDTSIFDYCVFTYGRAHGPYPDNFGGALGFIDFGKIIVDHCRFAYNRALWKTVVKPGGGAAIALLRCSPVIRNSLFEYNRGCIGAVLVISTDSTLVENNLFRYNYAPYFDDNREGVGGAIFCKWSSKAVIRGNTFYNNLADQGGGAIFCWNYGDALIEGNLFCSNSAGGYGGAIALDSCSSPEIINNTIVNNTAVNDGGGIDLTFNSNPEIRNTILWDNTAPAGSQVYLYSANCVPDFHYCNVQGGQGAFGGNPPTGAYLGCIDSLPWFENQQMADYYLLAGSPCINTGDPGMLDPDLSRCDIGCYYYNHTVVTALEPTAMNYLDSTFAANWEAAPGAVGYLLDVAYDENFTDFAAGYHNLDVGNVTSFNVDAGVMDNGYVCYYRVRAYYFMGRTGYSNTMGVFAVNIDENKDGSLITTIYPNPFTAVTTLSFRLCKPENVHFTVYNVQSQIVFDMQEKQDAGEQRIEFNADGLPAGMYYYRIVAGDRTGSGKLVVSD